MHAATGPTGADVGTLRDSLGTDQIAPYFGIGWGNAVGSGLGFALDLGVAHHGEPNFRFEATGPASSNAQFRADPGRRGGLDQRGHPELRGLVSDPELGV